MTSGQHTPGERAQVSASGHHTPGERVGFSSRPRTPGERVQEDPGRGEFPRENSAARLPREKHAGVRRSLARFVARETRNVLLLRRWGLDS